MNILGLSFGYHDSAAALVSAEGILAAAEEERFSRSKHDNGFPSRAIDYCLSASGLTASEIDTVVYYENTALKWDRIVSSYVEELDQHPEYLDRVISSWIYHGKFDPEAAIARYLGLPHCTVRLLVVVRNWLWLAVIAWPAVIPISVFPRSFWAWCQGLAKGTGATVWPSAGAGASG